LDSEAGLRHIDAVLEHGDLANYYLAHSARADMYRRLGRTAEARTSYEKALALTQQEPERQFLQERIRQLKEKRKKKKFLSGSVEFRAGRSTIS
jgi:RNA polymerase sigma-70 factor (ECF subfamily)